jgi:hypothetical protein
VNVVLTVLNWQSVSTASEQQSASSPNHLQTPFQPELVYAAVAAATIGAVAAVAVLAKKSGDKLPVHSAPLNALNCPESLLSLSQKPADSQQTKETKRPNKHTKTNTDQFEENASSVSPFK